MKKVIAFLLAALMILSMSTVAFAKRDKSSPSKHSKGEWIYIGESDKKVPGTTYLKDPKVTAEKGVTVNFSKALKSDVKENEEAVKDAGSKILKTIASTEITAKKYGKTVHTGATVELTVKGLGSYIDKTLLVVEDGEIVKSLKITTSSMVVALTSFSTYSFIVVDAPAKTVKSPNTGAASALAAIALVATGCAVVSKKHI